jgi:hypothetical protein
MAPKWTIASWAWISLAHALHPLTILPVGRPPLPLDTISYGIETKMFEELTAQHDDERSPIVVGLHAPGTDAGTLCILDAGRAIEEFGKIRVPAEAVGRYRRVAANQVVPLRDTPRKGDAKREAQATDAWLARSLDEAVRQMGTKPSLALKELQDSERDAVLRFGPENPRAALEASVLRLPRAFADFAAARRELHAFALARASGALDAAEARRILEGASTGARLDDARERFSRVFVNN